MEIICIFPTLVSHIQKLERFTIFIFINFSFFSQSSSDKLIMNEEEKKKAESKSPSISDQQEAAPKVGQSPTTGSERSAEVPVEPGPNQQHIHIGVSNRLPNEFALSFSGCGFLGTYHFGVMICFQKNAKVC